VITQQRIEELILPLLEDSEFEIVEIRLHGRSGRLFIAIKLDHRERSIFLDECAKWSRNFEDVFDITLDFPRQYALDVSSPGLGYPLMKEWQFKKNIGRTLIIEERPEKSEQGKPTIRKAKLISVEKGKLLFDDDLSVEMKSIIKAKVALPW